MVGTTDVTPKPRPLTDEQGNLEMEFLLPGVTMGQQPVVLRVGEDVAPATVTIVKSGQPSGNTTPVAEAVANLGDAFVRLFHFDNDTKSWSFYDPAAGDASTKQFLVTGQVYWILVRYDVEALLNGKTRTLSCVGDNCWNLVVW